MSKEKLLQKAWRTAAQDNFNYKKICLVGRLKTFEQNCHFMV